MTDQPQRFAPSLPAIMVEDAVRAALLEDLGRAGDLTTDATIDPKATASATLGARQSGIVCGMPCAVAAFRLIDPGVKVHIHRPDGTRVESGDVLATIEGNARAILSAERVALNYLMHLSAIASLTARYVAAIEGRGAKVCCTRKTVPGMRSLQKYAVKCGGGSNHRFGLDDAVLIKDNHIAVSGGIQAAIQRARASVGHLVRVEIEVDRLDQLHEALAGRPDVVLLDNMDAATMAEAVALRNARAPGILLEASGNVALDTIAGIAATGVDFISTSRITMAAGTLDIGLDIVID
jgi:nicotinate-nucleotide pyrophosphorylase (carboxylating)